MRLRVACALLAIAVCGCRRGPNTVFVAGGRAATVQSDVPAEESTAFEIGLEHWAYETRRESTYRYRVDAWGGGNAVGAAGHLGLEGESGLVTEVARHGYLFGRAGMAFELERNSANGLTLWELPVVTTGYQLHHPSKETPWHVEVGPRAGLALAGVAVAGDERARLGFAPEIGAAASVLYFGFAAELRAMRIFEAPVMDVVKASLCAGVLLVACLDQRTVITDFRGFREATTVWGISFGAGAIVGSQQ